MAGTVKTAADMLAELDAVLADGQSVGSITPVRLRPVVEDMIASEVTAAQVRNTQTVGYTPVFSDYTACIDMNSSSATTVTIPPNSSVAWPVGIWFDVCAVGNGQVSFVAGAGVTITTPSTLTVATQGGVVRAIQRAANSWILSGGLQPLPRTGAQRVGDFLNSLGVNTHIQSETIYQNLPAILGAIQFIGATAIRDDLLTVATNPSTVNIYSFLAQNGIGLCLLSPIIEDGTTLVVADCVNAAAAIVQRGPAGAIIALEMPNEPEITPYTYAGSTTSTTVFPGFRPVANFMSAYYTAVKSNAFLANVPLVHASVAGGYDVLDDGLAWLSVPNGYQNLTLTSNAVTTSSATLHFANTTGVQVGMFVYLSSTINGVSLGTVSSTTLTTVVLSATTTHASGTAYRFGACVPDATKFSDILNLHVYPSNSSGSSVPPSFGYVSAQSVDPTLPLGGNFFEYEIIDNYSSPSGSSNAIGPSLALAQSYPTWVTEYGYPTSGIAGSSEAVSTTVQAKNLITAWLNAWQSGIERFFIYSLYDDVSSPTLGLSFGMFTFGGIAKLAATYMNNFVTVLADTGFNRNSFSANPLGFSISNIPSSGDSVLFQGSSGTFYLVLWNNINNWNYAAGTPITVTSTTVTVSFERQGSISVYDPTVSATAQASSTGSVISLGITDYPKIISFI